MGVTFICVIIAVTSLWQQHYDAAFVVGTIGVLAWFLNYRVRVRQGLGEEEEQDNNDEESND